MAGWVVPLPGLRLCVRWVSYSIQTAAIKFAKSTKGALSRRVAMSQAGHFRQYAEEREPPRRNPWKFSPPLHASEYHLIDLSTGVSHGGFETLTGARQCAREKGLADYIFHGNVRVEYHEPR